MRHSVTTRVLMAVVAAVGALMVAAASASASFPGDNGRIARPDPPLPVT